MQMRTPASISSQDQLNKSVNQVLSGNVSPGNGTSFDTNGQPLTYSIDNMIGCIIRVGSIANPNALPDFWAGTNVMTTITHNLNKVPYGVILLANSINPATIYTDAGAWATDTTISIACTDGTSDSTIWILC